MKTTRTSEKPVCLTAPASETPAPGARIKLQPATEADVAALVALRTATAEKLTADHGPGPWSRTPTETGVRFEMRSSMVLVARNEHGLAASLRLATKKPWAIDRDLYPRRRRPLYLLAMAVAPALQGRGIGRLCLEEARTICRQWPADAIWLDAYDAPAGAGPFYARCGYREVGRAVYRKVPLVYFELSPP